MRHGQGATLRLMLLKDDNVDSMETLSAADSGGCSAEVIIRGARQWYLIALVNRLGRYEQVSVLSQRQYQRLRHRPDVLLLDRFHTIEDARVAVDRLRVVYGEEVTSRLDGQPSKRVAAQASL